MGQENICVAPLNRRKKRSKKASPAVRVVEPEEQAVSEGDEETTTEPEEASEVQAETYSWGFDPYVVLNAEPPSSPNSWMPMGDIQNAIADAGIVW